jgi:mitogen-activated protein kinase kinase kinase
VGLDSNPLNFTPTSSGSPRPPNSGSRAPQTSSANKRFSRQYDNFTAPTSIPDGLNKPPSRPSSPLAGADAQARPARQRFAVVNSAENSRREQQLGYFSSPSGPPSAVTITGRHAETPTTQQPQASRLVGHHTRGQGSIDGSLMSSLPHDQDVIRVISSGGLTKVVKIADCVSCDEVMRLTLRKFGYREDHDRNYCFYSLAGVEPDPSACRRLYEPELWRIIRDQKRPERNRLILRKIHAGEPGPPELQRAADIALEEAQASHTRALEATGNKRSQMKVAKVLGESWDSGLQHPLSPASFQSDRSITAGERERNVYNTVKDLERPSSQDRTGDKSFPRKKGVLRQFFGGRPPSELITSDLTTFFPDHSQEEINRTARLSLRRSQRLSRVNSRLSVASNISFASSLRDAPPMPNIADTWLQGNQLPKIMALDLSRNHTN